MLDVEDNSHGEWVTDDSEENIDNTLLPLTSPFNSWFATFNKPTIIWDRISRTCDISDSDISQLSPPYPSSQTQTASQPLSYNPQLDTLSPDSEFTNIHKPWLEQSDTLQVLFFIWQILEIQLSHSKQFDFESQLLLFLLLLLPFPEFKVLNKVSFTHKELSSPITPKYPDKHSPQVLVVEEHSSRFNEEQEVGTDEQSFQFKIELNNDTVWRILSVWIEFWFEFEFVLTLNKEVDFSNKNDEDKRLELEHELEGSLTIKEIVLDEIPFLLVYSYFYNNFVI